MLKILTCLLIGFLKTKPVFQERNFGNVSANLKEESKFMKRKMKSHRFEIVVKTFQTRLSAEHALLFAFAKRDPDCCEFNLLRRAPKKSK